MDKFEAYREQIDAYVQGRMTENDRLSFEQTLANQADLKEEVDLLLSYKASFQREDLVDFKSALDKVVAANEDVNADKVVNIRTTYLLAAAIVSILILSIIVISNLQNQIPSQYATKEVELSSKRSLYPDRELDYADSLFISFKQELKKENQQAERLDFLIKHIEKATQVKEYKDKYQDENNLLLARAYILNDKPWIALPILNKYWQADKTNCAVNYYQAIALLGVDRKSEAIASLEALDCPHIQETIKGLLDLAYDK